MKFKAVKLLPFALAAAMCGSMAAGCAKQDPPAHTHSYVYTDKDDENHTVTCRDCDEVNETEKHVYDDEQDTSCNKCGHVREVAGGTGDTETSTPLATGKKIYMVGDSTMCDYVKDGVHEDVKKNAYYVVRYGYGTQMTEYLNVTSDQVVNLALSGRSSKSFLSEANYTTLSESIGEGDYLIIGFGHNDQKTDMGYYTNPNLDTADSSTTQGASFKYTLYENYIKLAEDAGATPILCTPIVRQNDKGDYTGASGHVTEDKTVLGTIYKGGDYPEAIRELAEEKSVALIDLTAITKQIYMSEGADSLQYHAYRTYELAADGVTKVPSSPDTTHLNELGAKMVAYQFAQALKQTDCPLKAQVRSLATKPDYEHDFTDRTNDSYTPPTASAFDPSKASTLWTGIEAEDWYGTVFGSIGGQTKITSSNFEISESGGTFKVNCKSGNGKFSSSEEGMAAIFMQIDVAKDFTATATATFTGSYDNQSSFGMMLRDDIYIDKSDAAIKSNYVSAGLLNGKAIFMRKDTGSRVESGNSMAMTVGASYTFEIIKQGDNITANISCNGNNVTKTYSSSDVSLTESDSGYVYLCLYAIRNINVTFTDVHIL